MPLLTAETTYDALADTYDAFAGDFGHDRWLSRILELAGGGLPLAPGRVLDVGCGTGLSFAPLLRRGWEVSGCDASRGMLRRARSRADQSHRLFQADARRLPGSGPFDLVTCLDDAANYLGGADGVVAMLAGARRLLVPGGFVVFDVNTRRTFRTSFAGCETWKHAGLGFTWSGLGETARGDFAAEVRVQGPSGDVTVARHEQYHVVVATLPSLVAAAGLELVALRGQTTGCVLHRTADDDRHTKALVVARRPPSRAREEVAMTIRP